MSIAVAERWLPWARWPERYLVSTYGGVRSVDPSKVPHPTIRVHRGHKVIKIHIKMKRTQYLVNRMVAETFMPGYDPALPIQYFDSLGKSPNIENLWQKALPAIGSYVPNYDRTWYAPGANPVINLNTGEAFLSVTDAANHYGVSESVIRQVLNGVQLHTLGFQFERLEPYGF